MLQYIHYQTHLLLNTKYKIFINIAIYILIYLLVTNNQIAYCMTEGDEIPEIAEAKEPSHQVQALKKEITDFAGSQISLLEEIQRLQAIVENQEKVLHRLEQNVAYEQRTSGYAWEITDKLRVEIKEKEQKIHELNTTLNEIIPAYRTAKRNAENYENAYKNLRGGY